jgi:Peptidase family M28
LQNSRGSSKASNKQFLLIKSGIQTYIPVPVKVVFAGYGIDAPEYDYDDYRNINVSGKIVVLLEGEPYSSTDSTFFSGKIKTLYSIPESKIRTAFAKGAIGTILIPSNRSDSTRTWKKQQMAYSFEHVSLPQTSSSHLGVFLNRKSAALLFSSSERTYAQVLAWEHDDSLTSFELDVEIAFTGSFKQREFKSSNIIAILPGSDPELKNEFVIIGSHYDHLGIGKTVKNDSIYNGVLDNAVGNAVLLEIARMFSQSKLSPRRSILFILFTGEEKGLLGSEYYTKHPLVPLHKTIAMVNIDGLSALGKFKSLIGIGARYSDLGIVLQETASEHDYHLERLQEKYLRHLFARSDQLSFARNGVPSIMITEGFEYAKFKRDTVISRTINWFNKIYHSPFDDLTQPIDYVAIKNYTDFIFAFCNRLANTSGKIEWNKDAPFRINLLKPEEGQGNE